MTDEKFFGLLIALMGFCLGFLLMGLLGMAVGGDAEAPLRFVGLLVGASIGYLLWRRADR
jgi:hypothetical protein